MQQHERPSGRRPVPAVPSRRPRVRLALATAVAAALTGTLLSATAGPATAADGTHTPRADFNNDGFGDVAFSASGAYVSGKKDAGQLVVLYGTKTGVSSAKRSAISQNTTGNPGTAETGDVFGADSAYADFNGDGYDDLAVSSPMEDVGSDKDGGGVAVLWGSAQGITGKGVSIADAAPTKHDRWGRNLAAGDFDGDGKADLAVGNTSNTVYVLKGGISASGTALKGRYSVKAPVQASGDGSGPLNITAGDVNGDRRTDLVVDGFETATGQYWNTNYLLLGTSSGLSAASAQPLKAGVITGIGDVNGDGFGDIVTGMHWNKTDDGVTFPGASDGGTVWITYGTADGAGSTTGITQNTGNVPGSSERNDYFGYELDLGDVNGDNYQDLVVGVAGEDIGSVADAGQLVVLYGSASGINTSSGTQSFAQSTAGVPGSDEKGDFLGTDVKLDDVTGDGRADVLAGSYENDGNGAVLYLPSNGTKITATGSRTVSPSDSGVSTTGYPNFGANFGD
ncbi:VCBS repeat-containing protein [Streptomyces massasporeus]|uniref:VCBS repeat-containing protein n=1 Tax=Streptomyces TaxID=1883 RepID=UPI001C8C2BC0|nr:VCBS repeat-containing protein [Streptomyces sp. WAC04114]MBX9364523.1 VCBS repeat-containing protein [Streptomyces sp. WAC04114]